MTSAQRPWRWVDVITRDQVTLGVLAGGRASRLGGLDKAALRRGGVSQTERWRARFADEVTDMLISTNDARGHTAPVGMQPVPDQCIGDFGPLAGLQALAGACRTPWLLTIPVDLVDVDADLLAKLAAAIAFDGACAEDDDGLQPLVALWRVAALGEAVRAALAAADLPVQALHRRLDIARVRFEGQRFGNLNSPADLLAAGYSPP